LRRSGDWAMPTRIDRLLMFGALNWIVQWYRPRGPLNAAQIVTEAEKFFLRSRPKARAKARRVRRS
jgi:hypothetical protein